MKPLNATQTENSTKPAPKKLTLKRETLRRLTPGQLRLAAGGAVLRASGRCVDTDDCITSTCPSRYSKC
jgi:hypothetical protein